MIRKKKIQIIVTSIVTIMPMLAGMVMWNILPERITTHWGMSGAPDGFSSKAFTVFVLPLIMLAIHLLCALITAKDPKNKEQNSKVFGMILWSIPVVSLITNGMVYVIALGGTTCVDVWVRVLLGLMFIILGNYLPKCKQNHTIGVRVTWALHNEENWNKTHRFTGKLWVFGGVIILVTMFIPMEKIIWAFLTVVMLLSFAPMVYSYLYYRKQLKTGTATMEKAEPSPRERKAAIISLIISIPILLFAGITLFTGDIEMKFGEESFTIASAYWEDMTVEYAQIDSIEYREQDNSGSRTYGFGSLKLEMGNFENAEFGAYTRYSYIDCHACVVLRSKEGKVLVINGADEKSTQEIYEVLSNKIIK